MVQTAPYPTILRDLVARCALWPGWTVTLVDDMPRDKVNGEVVGRGLTLVITTLGYDSYHPDRGQHYSVHHYFIVPAATYDERSWRRWLFDQYAKVWFHEAMESFQIDGERPYAPSHGPGNDPYMLREVGTDEDRRTRFTGEVLP